MINPISTLKDLGKLKTKTIPKTVFWAIISYCNAVCTTCDFYTVPRSLWKYVELDQARKAVDILYDSDFRMTSITGGEPLLNPHVFDICDYIYKKGMIITYLPTNGILMTKEAARRLKEADVRLIGISIDFDDGQGMGLTRKIPDLRHIVVRARKYLDDVGIKTYAGILLTKSTRHVSKILDLVSELGFDRVVFSYPQIIQQSSYKASREMEDLFLDVKNLERVIGDIKAAKKDCGTAIHNPNVSLDELLRFYKGIPRQFKCHGGRKLFYLDWNLDLYRCFTLPKCYGNLLELGRSVQNIFEDQLCDLCCQQAFRDHDPFYHVASTLEEAWRLASKGNLISSARLLTKKETRDGFGAVSEFLSGGFS
jgi:MoaA/NifB/PqqE/SkfB family radical SAM enzyme